MPRVLQMVFLVCGALIADLVLAIRWVVAKWVVAMGGWCLLDAELVLANRWAVAMGGCYGWMVLTGC